MLSDDAVILGTFPSGGSVGACGDGNVIGPHDNCVSEWRGMRGGGCQLILPDPHNNCINIFSSHSTPQHVATLGQFGSAAGQFDSPRGVACDSGGRIIVCDHDNNRVQVVTPGGRDGSVTRCDVIPVCRPQWVAVDDWDYIYVLGADTTVINEVRTGANEVRVGANEVRTGANEVRTGANEVRGGVNEVRAGANEVRVGVNEVRIGANEVRAGVNEVRGGVNEVRAGVNEVRTGVDEVRAGVNEVREGVNEVRTGANEVREGVNDVRAGASEVRAGVNDVRAGVNMRVYEPHTLRAVRMFHVIGYRFVVRVRRLFTCDGSRGAVNVYDCDTGRLLRSLKLPASLVRHRLCAIAVTRDARIVVSDVDWGRRMSNIYVLTDSGRGGSGSGGGSGVEVTVTCQHHYRYPARAYNISLITNNTLLITDHCTATANIVLLPGVHPVLSTSYHGQVSPLTIVCYRVIGDMMCEVNDVVQLPLPRVVRCALRWYITGRRHTSYTSLNALTAHKRSNNLCITS